MTHLLSVRPLGDRALTLSFGTQRSAELLADIHHFARTLSAAHLDHVEDIVPSYLAITLFYDPLGASFEEMKQRLVQACETVAGTASHDAPCRQHVIPVRYDGVDLESVASAAKMSTEEVIALHTGRPYTVDLLGFVPGFAYLSELDPSLQLPRRTQPRPRVPAGSVAIAGAQTAVYPLDTPGGWHILGTTTVHMFDPSREPAALLTAGDVVRFEKR